MKKIISTICTAGCIILLSSCLNRELPPSSTSMLSETIPAASISEETILDSLHSLSSLSVLTHISSEPDQSIPETFPSTPVENKSNREETRIETIMLEGMKEEVTYNLFISPKGYSLYYDVNLYQVIESEKTDNICSTYPGSDLDINNLVIEHIENVLPEDEMNLRMHAAQENSEEILMPDEESGFIFEDGTVCQLIFTAWEADVGQHPGTRISTQVLLISDHAGGTYVFSIKCIGEAWEGAGSRLRQTLSTFAFE